MLQVTISQDYRKFELVMFISALLVEIGVDGTIVVGIVVESLMNCVLGS